MQSILQTKIWSEFKARHGWRAHELSVDRLARPIQVLERPLPFGKSLLYAPEVSLPEYSEQQLRSIALEAKKLSSSAIFFRLELFEKLGETTQSLVAALTTAGYRKSFEETQPEHRQWLSLTGDEATLLASMKEKGRYNVRLSARKGVTTRTSSDIKDVEAFYQIFQQTAVRDGFAIRTKDYFVDLCQTLFTHNLGELVLAEHGGQPLVALIITYYDGLASYLYGASSNESRNLMAPYAAHWAAIQAARARGCAVYDLLQIAPPHANEQHKYTNLTRFKQQFGGEAVALVGGWDFVYEPFWYSGFKLAEQWRRK